VTDRCPHDERELADLREWAWARGRTDVVLALDRHARGWAFLDESSRRNLLRLVAVMPAQTGLPERLRRLAAAGGAAGEAAALAEALPGWCRERCRDVDAALREQATGGLTGTHP
jgi:hypothetical protein